MTLRAQAERAAEELAYDQFPNGGAEAERTRRQKRPEIHVYLPLEVRAGLDTDALNSARVNLSPLKRLRVTLSKLWSW